MPTDGDELASKRVGTDLGSRADTDEQRRLEELLHYQACLIDSVTDAIVATDSDYKIITWNKAAERIYGWPAEDALGHHASEVLQTEVSPEQAQARLAAIDAGAHWEGRATQHRRDGSAISIYSSVTALRDLDGNPVGLVAINHDASEMRRLETELRRAHKLEAMGRMASSVAHDFNNLLMGMNGAADIMLRQLPEHSILRTYAVELKRLAQSGSQMTRQLLDIASDRQSEAGILLDDSIQALRVTLARLLGEQISLEVELGAPESPVALDLGGLGQILLNLTANARDAMADGGRLRIATSVTTNGDAGSSGTDTAWIALEVSDNGPGIAAETLEHIFEPFYTTKEKGKGTGLGLASVYAAVRRAGGSIEAISQLGEGTTFRMLLPVRPITGEPADAPRPSEVAPQLPEAATILVAEDNATTRLALQDLLEEAGFQVMAAATAAEALLLCEQVGIPDLLAVDLRLPDFPGEVLISSVREMNSDIPVILMSGRSVDDPAVRAIVGEPGVSFLQKPFDVDDLIQQICELRARP